MVDDLRSPVGPNYRLRIVTPRETYNRFRKSYVTESYYTSKVTYLGKTTVCVNGIDLLILVKLIKSKFK